MDLQFASSVVARDSTRWGGSTIGAWIGPSRVEME